MSSQRSYILGRIRWSLGRGSAEREPDEALRARLRQPKVNLVPQRAQLEPKAQIDLFVEMAREVNASVQRLDKLSSVPAAVSEYLHANELEQKIRIAPQESLKSLDWSGLTVSFGASDGEDLNGLSLAYAGVAETGTLAFQSGPESPTTLNFLPDNHLVVLKTSDLVGDYEAVYARMRRESNSDDFMPRALNWVTGPSRTADIEQTLLLGAHGPRKLHILLVDGDGKES